MNMRKKNKIKQFFAFLRSGRNARRTTAAGIVTDLKCDVSEKELEGLNQYFAFLPSGTAETDEKNIKRPYKSHWLLLPEPISKFKRTAEMSKIEKALTEKWSKVV